MKNEGQAGNGKQADGAFNVVPLADGSFEISISPWPLFRYGSEVLGLAEPELSAWVSDQFDNLQAQIGRATEDALEAARRQSAGRATGAAWNDADANPYALFIAQKREADEYTVGLTDGGSAAYSDMQWRQYQAKLAEVFRRLH